MSALALPLESASSDVLAVPFALEVSPTVEVAVAVEVAVVSWGRTHSPERQTSPAKQGVGVLHSQPSVPGVHPSCGSD